MLRQHFGTKTKQHDTKSPRNQPFSTLEINATEAGHHRFRVYLNCFHRFCFDMLPSSLRMLSRSSANAGLITLRASKRSQFASKKSNAEVCHIVLPRQSEHLGKVSCLLVR